MKAFCAKKRGLKAIEKSIKSYRKMLENRPAFNQSNKLLVHMIKLKAVS